MEQINWARVAGLFDGEGCIHKNKVQLDIGMIDKDLIVFCKEVFGVHNKICEYPQKSGKILYRLYVTGKANVIRVLESMLPYFGERRTQQALDCIERIKNSPYKTA